MQLKVHGQKVCRFTVVMENNGYFILKTKGKDYLYSDMPYSVWKDFKNANSIGEFYNKKIKHNYIFQLTK